MALTITTLQPQDGVGASRLTINTNFAAIKALADATQLLLDPTTSILTGVKSATINDAAQPLSNVIFQVGKGSALLGNVIMGTTGASTSVLINGNGGVTVAQSNVTLSSGNLTLSSATSLATFGGHISVAQEFRLPGVATAFASMTGLTVSGTLSVATLKYLVISNASVTGGLTASLSAGNPGQVLKISHVVGASGFPVYIDALNFSGLTGSIVLTKTADTLECVYDGAAWYLLGYNAASYPTGGTVSSITITTL